MKIVKLTQFYLSNLLPLQNKLDRFTFTFLNALAYFAMMYV